MTHNNDAVIETLLHDMSQPLTAIRGCLELGLELSKTTEEYREAIEEAMEQVDRLMQLTRRARLDLNTKAVEKDKGPALSMEA